MAIGESLKKYFSRTHSEACLEVEGPKKLRYKLDDFGGQLILEAFHDFQNFKAGISHGNRWEQDAARNAGEYVRGVAATLPDGTKLNLAADLLEAVDQLLSRYVTVEEIES